MENNIIQVKQLPIIVEQLHEVKAEVTAKVEQALSLYAPRTQLRMSKR